MNPRDLSFWGGFACFGYLLRSCPKVTSDYSGCVSRLPVTDAFLFYYTGPNGATQQIKACTAAFPFQTAFQATADNTAGIEAQNYSSNYNLVDCQSRSENTNPSANASASVCKKQYRVPARQSSTNLKIAAIAAGEMFA
jgi:hypothetical protein